MTTTQKENRRLRSQSTLAADILSAGGHSVSIRATPLAVSLHERHCRRLRTDMHDDNDKAIVLDAAGVRQVWEALGHWLEMQEGGGE